MKLNRAPENWLVPCLVIELTIAPRARPNSASNWLVRTWNSDTDSSGTRTWPPAPDPLMSSLFVAPSIPIELLPRVCPLAIIVSLPRLDEGRNWMPGRSATAAKALRLPVGSSVSSRVDTVPPTSAEVRSTSGASPETVIVSSSAPICMTMSRSRVRPTPMAKSVRSKVANPGNCAAIVKTPGSNCAAK